MGRGRQKAKHQKVARALKYQTTTIDTLALEHELAGDGDDGPGRYVHYRDAADGATENGAEYDDGSYDYADYAPDGDDEASA